MTLDDWMTKHEKSTYDVGEVLKVNPCTVSRLRRGLHMPNTSTLRAVIKMTGGKVGWGDFAKGAAKPK